MSPAIVLRAYPEGAPRPGDFVLIDEPERAPGEGEVLVAVTHLSMDPMPRTRMQPAPPFGPPMPLGGVVPGRGVGRVLASACAGLAPGDIVLGELGWRARAVLPGSALIRATNTPVHANLNALGPTGLAAYFVVELAAPRPGDTVLIAPAGGAVGSLAAQIVGLRAPGARVFGAVRGAAQRAFVAGLGMEPVHAEDPGALPPGIDVLIDGVGGALHDQAVERLNPHARVLLLGFISGYAGAAPPRYGNAAQILMKRATMRGFLLADHMEGAERAYAELSAWIGAGALRPAETIWRGLAQAPAAFAALFGEAPPGKQIVAVEEGDDG